MSIQQVKQKLSPFLVITCVEAQTTLFVYSFFLEAGHLGDEAN